MLIKPTHIVKQKNNCFRSNFMQSKSIIPSKDIDPLQDRSNHLQNTHLTNLIIKKGFNILKTQMSQQQDNNKQIQFPIQNHEVCLTKQNTQKIKGEKRGEILQRISKLQNMITQTKGLCNKVSKNIIEANTQNIFMKQDQNRSQYKIQLSKQKLSECQQLKALLIKTVWMDKQLLGCLDLFPIQFQQLMSEITIEMKPQILQIAIKINSLITNSAKKVKDDETIIVQSKNQYELRNWKWKANRLLIKSQLNWNSRFKIPQYCRLITQFKYWEIREFIRSIFKKKQIQLSKELWQIMEYRIHRDQTNNFKLQNE